MSKDLEKQLDKIRNKLKTITSEECDLVLKNFDDVTPLTKHLDNNISKK